MIDGMSGINTHGIETALNYEYWIDPTDRHIIFQKILVYLTTMLRVSDKNYIKEDANGKKSPDRSDSR